MLRLKFEISNAPDRNSLKRFNKGVHSTMSNALKAAVRAFIKIVFHAVAVDSGMTRGSLMSLYEELKRGRVAGEGSFSLDFFSNTNPDRRGYTLMDGTYIPKKLKGPRVGRSQHNKIRSNKNALLFGSPERPKFQFRFQVNIYQWAIHESTWDAMHLGSEAFIAEYRRSFIPRIPALGKMLLSQNKKVIK